MVRQTNLCSNYQKTHISGVSKAAHDLAKQFCKERGLKLGVWVSQAIRREIKRVAERDKERREQERWAKRRAERAVFREHAIACDEEQEPSGDGPRELFEPPFWERENSRDSSSG
jgi:hypothetical protein